MSDDTTGHMDTAWRIDTACVTNLGPARFALEQAKATIRRELEALPPFHTLRDEKHAELDQLDDMIARRR